KDCLPTKWSKLTSNKSHNSMSDSISGMFVLLSHLAIFERELNILLANCSCVQPCCSRKNFILYEIMSTVTIITHFLYCPINIVSRKKGILRSNIELSI